MGRLEERFINYVRNAVDLSTGNTGYPVLGKHLEEAGVATRKQLRILEKKGHLKTIDVLHKNSSKMFIKGTIHKAYYTERSVPKWVTKQQETAVSKAVEEVFEA